MRGLPFLVLLAALGLNADSMRAPVLQWYKTVSGSGPSDLRAVGSDTQGNLYIAGNTASLDFPIVAAAQNKAGGSPITRIDTASGSARKVYSPGLAAASSIAVDPENSNTLYATSAGLLLRSTDAGNTWTPLSAFPSAATVNSIAVDPANSNNLYAVTSPLGAFKSTDGGASWTAINNGFPPSLNLGTNAPELNVYQIWIDPKSPAVLFAYTSYHGASLFRSTDAGASWTQTLSGASFYGFLAFDPFTPGTIYVDQSKSTDEGQTWIPFSTPGAFPSGQIVPDPFHAGTLYFNSFGDGVYQSTDAGATWNLKIKGATNVLAADPKQPVLYTYVPQIGIVKSTDGLTTYSAIGPPATILVGSQLRQLQVAGASLFAVSVQSTDVFVVKLDPDGNILYSTYFGGSGIDTAMGMAVGNDGSVYVAGQTNSADFPVTAGVYAAALPSATSNFVFKLNPDGSVAWSTYFATVTSTINAIAVDAGGNPYISGSTFGGLPTTPGAYQTQFTAPNTCGIGNIGPCFPPSEGFLTKFDSKGSALVFSTYIGNAGNSLIGAATGLALDPASNAYMAGGSGIFLMNATGSSLLKSTAQRLAINALALDSSGNVYATGSSNLPPGTFPATPGAFQASPQPAYPALPGQSGAGGDAFVLKFDSGLSQILAATLLGGEGFDIGRSIAVDSSTGTIVISGETDSQAFPTRAPFQGSFAPRSGFVSGFDSTLSQLLFSTYVGSTPFTVRGAILDGRGNILLAGSTLDSGSGFTIPATVIANKIALPPAPAIRLDSVVNFASQIGLGLSPGEAISVSGAGFGSDAQLLLDGTPLQVISVSQNRIVAVIPTDAPTSGARQVTVSSSGASSNPMFMPAAPAAPGIYSIDGSGFGQGYILNADGTLNSPSNPAAPGSAITILATGVGQISMVNGFAVTALPVAVFVDGFYANGIAAVMKQVPGEPGDVYEIGVFVPDPANLAAQNPDLKGFKFPPLVPVRMVMGGVGSQFGIALSVK